MYEFLVEVRREFQQPLIHVSLLLLDDFGTKRKSYSKAVCEIDMQACLP